jgi:hypothetical protein
MCDEQCWGEERRLQDNTMDIILIGDVIEGVVLAFTAGHDLMCIEVS